jgi:carbon monoxide dehydrogenase subunit G
MTLDGTFTFNGPRQTVWTLLQDPAVLARALPGTERLELVGPDQYRGVMKASVGPVTAARFDVIVTLRDKTEPERFVVQLEGKGPLGHTRGSATIELAEAAPQQTTMRYNANVLVGGTIAAVGQRMLDSVSRSMMTQALQSLDRELKARLDAPERATE